uniref:Replication-associated protein n=1 Tax=Cressdnaviricota sp. TaxID=2748378 RepID=A0A6M9Z7U6_9VIRU|nr:MAG: replication-associated protein [Cressdnaviricota sp.]
MAQSTRWCFTLNNPTDAEHAYFNELSSSIHSHGIRYLVYGREVGDGGTPHLQGFVIFDRRLRLGSVRDLLGNRGHYECARAASDSASNYCKKDGDFTESGTLPDKRRSAPSVADFCQWVRGTGNVSEREIANKFPGLFLRYGDRLMKLKEHILDPPVLEENVLNDWQTELHETLTKEADDRTIDFYIDIEGGKGKSFFCRWMVSKYPDMVQILSGGKRDDLAHAIDVTKRIFLFNLPRGGIEFMQYSILEQLKDRVVFSPKYSSSTKILKYVAHVVVFCNEHPDETKMSVDRYKLNVL